MNHISSDIVFSDSVKAKQREFGSRANYERLESSGGFATQVDDQLVDFLSRQKSFLFATANREGQPYVQHRGGAPGFLKVLSPTQLAFLDFSGNRQYITVGNLAENPRCQVLLIDYEHRRRVKIWGRGSVVHADQGLVSQLGDPNYRARVERAIVVDIEAWDVNCPSHIPWLLPGEDVLEAIAQRDQYIAELEERLKVCLGEQ